MEGIEVDPGRDRGGHEREKMGRAEKNLRTTDAVFNITPIIIIRNINISPTIMSEG